MLYCLLILWLHATSAWAHSVDHQVQTARAVVITVLLGEDEPASYSQYEVFAPGQTVAFQQGRSDRLGRVVFAPDCPGKWKVTIQADSSHGIHGTQVEVDVAEDGVVVGYSQPLVARHTRLFVGLGLLMGLFGGYALLKRPNRTLPSVAAAPIVAESEHPEPTPRP